MALGAKPGVAASGADALSPSAGLTADSGVAGVSAVQFSRARDGVDTSDVSFQHDACVMALHESVAGD